VKKYSRGTTRAIVTTVLLFFGSCMLLVGLGGCAAVSDKIADVTHAASPFQKQTRVVEVQMPKYTDQNITQAHLNAVPVCVKEINAQWASQGRNARIELVEERSSLANTLEKGFTKLGIAGAALLTRSSIVGAAGKRIAKNNDDAQQYAEQQIRTCVFRKVGSRNVAGDW